MKQKYEKGLFQKARKSITSAHNSDDPEKFTAAFQQKWHQWIVDVPVCEEHKTDINNVMMDVLCETNSELNSEMTEKLKQKHFRILSFTAIAPVIDSKQLSISFASKAQQEQEVLLSADTIQDKAVTNALDFAKKISKSGVRCSRNDLTQMYHRVIKIETEKLRFKFRKCLKCNISLYTFANAYTFFDKMEERYIQERDIRGDLERNLQPRLESYL